VKLPIEKLAGIRLRSGAGVFVRGADVYRVHVARTPMGVQRVEDEGEILQDMLLARARAGLRDVVARVPRGLLTRFSRPKQAASEANAAVGTEPEDAPKAARVRPINVGVKASAVTLHSEAIEENQAGQAASSADRDAGKNVERRPAKVVEDTLVVELGKKKRVRLTTRARIEELQAIAAATGLEPADGHRFEPAPWAVWRASSHYAPFKKGQALHLRFVLGETTALALLATTKQPVAWHALSWEQGSREESLVQAFHLLRIHAVRRLRVEAFTQISLQGEPFAAECQASLGEALGVNTEIVPGPAYDGDFVAFGLALGSLQTGDATLNLARSLQPAPSILQLVPWGEASLLLSLFLCMFLVLKGHLSGMRKQLGVATQQAQEATWAHGRHPTQLKQELDSLKREVEPLEHFLTRELSFAQAMSALTKSLPPKVWIVTLTAEDLFWEKNSNKALGEHYILVTAGAPSEREGMAPPEINETVDAIEDDPLFQKILPRLKLADINWRKETGVGFTVFSLLATPKEAASGAAKK
jgi:hypothetical protein